MRVCSSHKQPILSFVPFLKQINGIFTHNNVATKNRFFFFSLCFSHTDDNLVKIIPVNIGCMKMT